MVPDGFDCDAGGSVLIRMWNAHIQGAALDQNPINNWGAHVRGGCRCCAGYFARLGELAGYGSSEVVQLPSSGARDTAACTQMVAALRKFVGARIIGQDGKPFELEISTHMCGCYSCRALLEIFGGAAGLSFGEE